MHMNYFLQNSKPFHFLAMLLLTLFAIACNKSSTQSASYASTAGSCFGAACTSTIPSTKYFAPDSAIFNIVVATPSYYDPPKNIQFMTDTGMVTISRNVHNYWDTSIHIKNGTQVILKACGPKNMRLWFQLFSRTGWPATLIRTDSVNCQ
jgi:hypothetical protein